MQLAILILFIILGTSLALRPSISKQYRHDYEYNPITDAFYKLHADPVYYRNAIRSCETEGATLMVPSNKEDIRQLHKMLKQFPDINDDVFIGDDRLQHESAEETQIIDLDSTLRSSEERNYNFMNCEVVNRDGEIKSAHCNYRSRPFICKVEAKDAPYDEQCDVYDKGYKYYSNVLSCYKMSPARVCISWDEAYAQCRAQGAHLLILNSKLESDTIKEYLRTQQYGTYSISAGIREVNPSTSSVNRVFKTIFNETLEQAGFSEWSPGEPNNSITTEDCGSITHDALYNDVPCSYPLNFICEKEVSGI